MHASLPARSAPTFALTMLCAALLAACGGGGGEDASPDATGTSADTATTYAANATLIGSDAATAVDTAAVTAEVVIATQAAAATPSMPQALAVAPAAVSNVPVACPGGGSAALTISGGSAAGILNGKLDTGEAYQLVFADCKGAAGAASVNGTLAMTVDAATATSLSLSMAATNLAIALPSGSVTVSGSTMRQVSSSVDAAGATQQSSHLTTPSLALTTRYNARTGNFTLSAVDVTRRSTWLNGLPQSSSVSGTHTLAATLANGSFNCTVSTQGSVSYSAAGAPVSGVWAIALSATAIGVSVGGGVATITVDDGKNGTIDRTVTVPIGRLQTDAG